MAKKQQHVTPHGLKRKRIWLLLPIMCMAWMTLTRLALLDSRRPEPQDRVRRHVEASAPPIIAQETLDVPRSQAVIAPASRTDHRPPGEVKDAVLAAFTAERSSIFFEPAVFFAQQKAIDAALIAQIGRDLEHIEPVVLAAGPMPFSEGAPAALLKRMQELDLLALAAEFGHSVADQQAALFALAQFILTDVDVRLDKATQAAMLGDKYEAMSCIARLDRTLANAVVQDKTQSRERLVLEEALQQD